MAIPMYVEVDSGDKQFELHYTAVTKLRNAVLTIQIPPELLAMRLQDLNVTPADQAFPLTLTSDDETTIDGSIDRAKIGTGDDPRNSSDAGYVYTPNNYVDELIGRREPPLDHRKHHYVARSWT